MPEDLATQLPILKEILAAMNIPMFTLSGWEADDVLGTVGRICGEKDWDCVIVTGDRDSLQLVDEHVTVKLVTTKGGRTQSVNYTPDVFRAEYGFPPPGLIDLKALMGDSSDNYPGVPGVGEKTARELMGKYGSLEKVYENAESPDLKPAVRRKLAEGRGACLSELRSGHHPEKRPHLLRPGGQSAPGLGPAQGPCPVPVSGVRTAH